MFPTIDLLARGGTIALLALWSFVLLRDHRAVPAARAAVAMAAAIVVYVIAAMLMDIAPGSTAALLCDAVSVLAAPLFWLFARLWFDDRARVGWRSWALLAGFAVLTLLQFVLITHTNRASTAIWVLVRLGMTGSALAGMWVAWRGRASDLVEPRRAFRLALVLAIGCFVLWVNALETGSALGWPTWQAKTLTQVAVLLVTMAAVAGLHAARSPQLFAFPTPMPATPAAAFRNVESPLIARLRHAMGTDRAYRAEGFSLTALSALLGEPEYRVRRAINRELGYRNFTAFLNSYRLDEVKAALADPAQREVPILTIALDAGFGSLGPFNRAFRESAGMTPSEFRAAAQR